MSKYNFGSYLKELTRDVGFCAGRACFSAEPRIAASFHIPDLSCNGYCLPEQGLTKQEMQKIMPIYTVP
jgi:hypothetical protein